MNNDFVLWYSKRLIFFSTERSIGMREISIKRNSGWVSKEQEHIFDKPTKTPPPYFRLNSVVPSKQSTLLGKGFLLVMFLFLDSSSSVSSRFHVLSDCGKPYHPYCTF